MPASGQTAAGVTVPGTKLAREATELAAPEVTVRPPGKPERRGCGALLLAGT
ncbi:MAG TPA: hypothetical protein VG253_22790 [Streptosporangiaceae bacterium]|jgi:hypothetical protein|nr:hypothetical protein [Streptosporangiaceae bacterium]